MCKILIVSPVRNEGEYIEKTLESVVSQSVLPFKWIIVNDGSSDRTEELVRSYAERFPWIQLVNKPDRGARAVGPGVVEAFYYGLDMEVLDDYDFVCKMDGDISFGPDYFKNLLEKFEADKSLGAASGKPYIVVDGKEIPERTNDEMVAGQINFYRTVCFKSIDGFVRQVHWDAIAFHRARMGKWRTKSFDELGLRFIHLRIMGSSDRSLMVGRLRWGKGQYFIGTHPLYLLAIGVYRAFERPFIIGGVLIVFGYLRSWIKRESRYEYPGFRKSLHAWQLERLGIGKRLEIID